ncbi:kinase-like domain-containing protein [Globomyces pollinis-pini]|nr:kinase-like domain-containing protein [Globomyces pollinis-pini]
MTDPLEQFIYHRREIILRDSNDFHGINDLKSNGSIPKAIVRKNEEDQRKKQQGKLLLVALLENYCMLYDQSTEQNQKLFFVLCQQLCRMGIIDNTYFLDEFSTVRSSYKKAFKDLVIKAMKTVHDMNSRSRALLQDNSSVESGDEGYIVPSPLLGRTNIQLSNLPVPTSDDLSEYFESGGNRFHEEFHIMDTLGKGAFGMVLKTKNKLDGCCYALKLIQTPTNGGLELIKTIREVKLLAGISHNNIVGYYASWMQYMDPIDSTDSDSDDYEESWDEPSSSMERSESMELFTSKNGNSISFRQDISFMSSEESKSTNNVSESISTASLHSIAPNGVLTSHKNLFLFIQMELCESTLHSWLETLNLQTHEPFRRIEEKILHCFIDLLKGVQVIHRKGYIHRDLKPKNIYWKAYNLSDMGSKSSLGGRQGTWKIGDFGLATLLETPAESFSRGQKQSLGIGTVTYASPEQLDSSQPHTYSYETDIYSLGIILFELLVCMGTGMERAEKLGLLRQGILPKDFLACRPKEAALILWMMSPEPALRPTVSQIFELEWFAPFVDLNGMDCLADSKLVDALEHKLKIAEEKINSKTLENERLKRKILELEAKLKS